METQKTKTSNRYVSALLIMIIIAASVGIIYNLYINYNPPLKKYYCHYEKVASDDLPRKECGNIALVTTDLAKVDIKKFLANFPDSYCTKKIKELEWCDSEEKYYAEYPLQLFAGNSTVDGQLCMAYMVEFLDSENENFTRNKAVYEQMFAMNNFDSIDELKEKFSNCERRQSDG